jgi:HTH-type transcriptional regulator / antitoxin MqsA
MKCPICGSNDLVYDRRDFEHSYRGMRTTISDVRGKFCGSCNDVILDPDESKRVSDAMLAFNREVNATLGDPDFIAGVRKKLNLNQGEAGEIFGGGVNAFSRYETGTTKPPLALVKLFKVLDRHPELLNEIR